MLISTPARLTLTALFILALTACGGSGSPGDTHTSNTAPPSINLSGTAAKGLFIGADVTLYALNEGQPGRALSSTVTNDNGAYTFQGISGVAGPVLIEMKTNANTRMLDEVKGAVAAPPGLVLRAAVADIATSREIHLTPFSEMAVTAATSGGRINTGDIDKANLAVSREYLGGVPLLTTQPLKMEDFFAGSDDRKVLTKALTAVAVSADQQNAVDENRQPCRDVAYADRLKCAVKGLARGLVQGTSNTSPTADSAVLDVIAQGLKHINNGDVDVIGSDGKAQKSSVELGREKLSFENRFVGTSATSSTSAVEVPAMDMGETIHRVNVKLTNSAGRTETRPLVLTVFKPASGGPFPLVVINHGRGATPAKRAQQARSRYEDQARYFVSKGFAVIAPTRVGYGETYGDFDPESLLCTNNNIAPFMRVLRTQVVAAVDFARTQPDIDTRRWLVTGSSVGGVTTLAVLQDPPPGLAGGINFAGGFGGNPDTHPGQPCGASRLGTWAATPATTPSPPNLWIYWQNDAYWGANYPKTWFNDWAGAGHAGEFLQLPAIEGDGHTGFTRAMDTWVPTVEAFLAKLGLGQPCCAWQSQKPAVTTGVRVEDIDAVPVPPKTRDGLYKDFLNAASPRAFVISPSGRAGFARGDWAIGRALGFCQKLRGETCAVYAVDNEVVWQGTPAR